jgi:hypothetical protein
MEQALRQLTPANELYIVAGGAGVGGSGNNGFATTIANGKITVPAFTWKVALVIPKGESDVSRVSCASRTIAVIVPNTNNVNTDWTAYLTSVDAVEQLTGYDFFSELPEAVEACVEAGVNGANPPGAESQSVTTQEDTQKPITLNGLSANNSSLDYILVSQPTQGTLTGSGANLVYTPAADYFGSDSFTFKVKEGANESNVATVSITVDPVNDAPTLAPIGNKTVLLGDTLTFTAVGSDIDNASSALTYSLSGNVPSGAAINSATGEFSWTPAPNQVGQVYTFNVRVSDGALSAQETISVAVAYQWSNLLEPININGSRVFRLGSTVPVKFKLTGASQGISTAVAKLTLAKVTNGVVGTEFAAESTAASNGNLFRYDAQNDQYIFNLNTRNLTAGEYQLRVDLGDGVSRTARITLQ